MEWVKLAAVPAYYIDGALLRAGEAAEVLFCRGLAYCGGVESKGVIDKTVLSMLVQTRAQARADALVREGLWVDEGLHYRIRSWDKWQDAHDIAAEKKAKDRQRKRDERQRKRAEAQGVRGQSTDSHADASTDSPVTVQRCHNVEGEGEGDREEEDSQTLLLDVVERAPATARASHFDAFWQTYPRKVGKAAARKAYDRACKTAGTDAVFAGLLRFIDDPTRDPAFTPHPATWLNQGRWEDEGPVRPRSTEVVSRRLSTTDQRVASGLALVAHFREQEGA